MKTNYSTYNNGLKIGDLVYLNHKAWIMNYNMNCLVLKRKFLFEKNTRFGNRSFFEYDVLSFERNKIIKIKTQDIRILKVTRGK
jgi:hypothetical protein